MQQGNHYAAGTGADIRDGCLVFTSPELQRGLNDDLGLRSRNQHVRVNFEVEFEKLLVSGDVLQRFAGGAARDQRTKVLKLLWRQGLITMRDEKSSVATRRVREQ